MASWLVSVLFCAVIGTAVADSRFTFPELVSDQNNRIVSGWEAELGQFPHQLSLRMVNPAGAVSACGGSIIHPEWGLTAAHCTAGRVTVVIRAGTVNLTTPTYIFETTKYYNHPLYDEGNQGQVQPHDIGLLEFGRSLVFNDNVKPIRIQRSSAKNINYADVVLVTSGWGRNWTLGLSPENLNWVYQRGVSNRDCLIAFGGSNIIVDSTICSRFYNVTSQSTCQGDSGGPLTHIDDDGEITQIGVTSFVSSMGCHVGMPAGFIRPGHYHDWFTEISGVNFDWEFDTTTGTPTVETVITEESTTEQPTTGTPTADTAITEPTKPTTKESTTEEPTTEEPTTEASEESSSDSSSDSSESSSNSEDSSSDS